jgi:hypothetical protein
MKKLLLLTLAIATLINMGYSHTTPPIKKGGIIAYEKDGHGLVAEDSTLIIFWENNINNRKWVITHLENKSSKTFRPDGKWFYFFDSLVIFGEDSRIEGVASNHPTFSGNNAFILKLPESMTLTFDTLCFTDIIDFDGNKIGKELIILKTIADTDGTEEGKYNIILEKYDDDICSINNWAGKYTVDYLIAKHHLITFERRINDIFSDGSVLLNCNGKETLKIERTNNKLIGTLKIESNRFNADGNLTGTYSEDMRDELHFQEDGWVFFGGIDPEPFFSKTKYAALLKINPKGLCELMKEGQMKEHLSGYKKCWCGDSH